MTIQAPAAMDPRDGLARVPGFIESVEGWLSLREGRCLYRLAAGCRGRGAIVEVGSWKGRSTLCLAAGSLAGAGTRILAVDPHTGSPEQRRAFGEVHTLDEFRANLGRAGLDHLVTPMVMTSLEAARAVVDPIELIFIDGAHEYEAVRADFEAWFPRVIDGGVMAFHDTASWNGPGRLVRESVFGSPRFRRVGIAGSITWAEKVTSATPAERLSKGIVLARKLAIERAARMLGRVQAEPPGG